MTSPAHFIVGGVRDNEGTVLTRTSDLTDHRFELSDSHKEHVFRVQRGTEELRSTKSIISASN